MAPGGIIRDERLGRPKAFDARRFWRVATAAMVVCSCLAAFTASQIRLFLRSMGSDAPWTRLLLGQLFFWYLWVGLIPLVVLVSRKAPFERSRRLRSVAIHTVGATAVGLTHTLLRVAALPLILGRAEIQWTNEIVFNFSAYFHWNVAIYVLIVASEHAWRYEQRYRERELEMSRLRALLAEARLNALRAQLHPHFLFNALQSVTELIHEHPQTAEDVILRLSELLRRTLKQTQAAEVPLEEEIDFLRQYLEVEKVRFEERLRVVWDVSSELLKARVPPFVLQPLVENACRHGLAKHTEGGTITIAAQRRNGDLELRVSDNGVGLGRDEIGFGLGLENTRARLQQCYGDRHLLELGSRPEGGVWARIVLPYRVGSLGEVQEP